MKKAHSLIVSALKLTTKGDKAEFSAVLTATDNSFPDFKLWYRFPLNLRDYITPAGDPFVALLLPIAMLKKYDLVIEGTVSERLLTNTQQTMQLLAGWFEYMEPIKVQPKKTRSVRHGGKAIGSFFTGGVDSFYTVLKNLNDDVHGAKISHLLYVYGFDIEITNTELFKKVDVHLQRVAEKLELELVNISTNLRKFTDTHISWGDSEYGAALASAGLTLSKLFKTILIPSGHPYAKVYPTGIHPLLDPLWSNESTHFIQDGNEADRNQKIEWQLKKHPVALNNLRVCWQNPENSYNCGRCAKCIRTKISLAISGALENCTTFENSIDLDLYAKLASKNSKEKRMLTEIIDYLEWTKQDDTLKAQLKTIAAAIPEKKVPFRKKFKYFDAEYLNGNVYTLYSSLKG